MSNLVIVAIPEADDYVWKISSEKVPHMTLLFLGDAMANPNVFKIQEFLEHAVNILEIGPFGMDVDYRGTLGADDADVLFFREDWWSYERIAEFRSQLLKNTAIRNAYDSTPQFEGPWQPHLTLGYPATPAKPITRDYAINYVRFDRIALWFGDYEGPEFRLSYRNDRPEVAMSSTTEQGEAFLKHFGVKGMHWGQRKDRNAPGAIERRQAVGEAAVRARRPAVTPRVHDSIGTSAKTKTTIKARGGEDHPATADALRVAAHEQKIKKSGTHALTNKELQEVAQRLQLEQQVHQLRGKRPTSKGKKFVDSLLQDPAGTMEKGQAAYNLVSPHLKR